MAGTASCWSWVKRNETHLKVQREGDEAFAGERKGAGNEGCTDDADAGSRRGTRPPPRSHPAPGGTARLGCPQPEDRRGLHEKTGSDGIFHTSNAVHRLCGDDTVKVTEKERDEEATERGPKLTTAQLIKKLARVILAVRPLAEELASSDDHREEDRRLLREKVGDADLRRTASLLNQLCSERARALIRGVRYRRPPSLPRGST